MIAGLGDLTRPAEKLSVSQSGALAATGLIWSRLVEMGNTVIFSFIKFFFIFITMFYPNYSRMFPSVGQGRCRIQQSLIPQQPHYIT